MKTREQVIREFHRRGQTISGWASENGFTYSNVRNVLSGRLQCRYGKAHAIAVLLGLKDGEILAKKRPPKSMPA